MSVKPNDSVSVDDARLEANDETLYVQTDDEYDQIFSKAQMSVVDDIDMQTCVRVCGPSGCGKTTLARSLAIDVKIADELINSYELPIYKMNLDELALFHDIVTTDGSATSNQSEEPDEDEGVCPSCGANGSIYARDRKEPTYRCGNCQEEFETPAWPEDDESENESGNDEWMDEFEAVNDVENELERRGLLDDEGETTDAYPHSRAAAYRDLYKVYTGGEEYPSSPYFEVTMSHAKYAKDLIGHPHIDGDETTFIKGKVSKGVESSQNEATVMALDEINRAPTSAKDELYDALDGRVKVSLDEAGGKEIAGDPSNLIVISTMNKGPGHHVEPLDFAEKRRLGPMHNVDFLGREYPEKEVELVVANSEVPEELASEMVSTANEIRTTAENEDTDLSYGVPTGSLLEWADEAYTNYLAGIEQPVVRAGESAVARSIYDHDETEVREVTSIISKNLNSVPFDPEEDEEFEAGSTRYVCQDATNCGCSWSATESEAPVEAREYLVCPECEGELDEKGSGQ